MRIEFAGEAYETFQRTLDALAGLTVQVDVNTEDEAIDPEHAARFDAVLLGADRSAEWGDTIRYRDFDEETAEAVGPEKSVRIERVYVY